MTSLINGDGLSRPGLIPRNPYIAGRALADARSFFGREDIFRLVETVLSQSDQNGIVLFGQRRIGKTSVLLHLRHHLPFPPFRPVYFDLMDRARKPLNVVLYELAATIAAEFDAPPPHEDEFTPKGDGFRERFLPLLLQRLGADVRPVILFDEFDVLDVAAEENLPETAAARAFFPFLRRLMESEPRLAFVFVVGRKAEDLSINVKATFKAARYQRISVLDPESASQLVGLAERDGTLRFTPPAVERLLGVTTRHPYFTQLMCQLLFDQAYAGFPTITPTIDVNDVEAVIPKTLEAGENIFEWVWDGLPPAERVIFSAVAEVTGANKVITEDELTGVLQRHGIRILIRELELAPKTLIEWEMLRRVDGGYGFFIDLMRRWVALRKPLPKVKDELDRINPIADQQYHLGYTFYRLGNVLEALTPLKAALQVNPNHLKARLLLGEALREQGSLDESVKELEEAYRYDEDAARYPLVRGLLALAESMERAGHDEEAIVVYERVLAISPRESVARERRQALLIIRGDRVFLSRDYDAALAAYREAGADGKVASVLAVQRTQALEAFNAEIGKLTAREDWDGAVEQFRRLIELDPQNPRWLEELKSAEREASLARRYSEGLGAQQQDKMVEAQRAFADVIASRPDYKDAAERLASVVRHMRAAQSTHTDAPSELADEIDEPRRPSGILWSETPQPVSTRWTSPATLLSVGVFTSLFLNFAARRFGFDDEAPFLLACLTAALLLTLAVTSHGALPRYRSLIAAGLAVLMTANLRQGGLLLRIGPTQAMMSVLGYGCYIAAFGSESAARPRVLTVVSLLSAAVALVLLGFNWFVTSLVAVGAVAWTAIEQWRARRSRGAKSAALGGMALVVSHIAYWIANANETDYDYWPYMTVLFIVGCAIETTRYAGHWLIAMSVRDEPRGENSREPS